MTDSNRIVIVGGHGKVALLASPKFASAGYAVDALIRNPEHRTDVEGSGANPVLLDIESATLGELAEAFTGASAVVFSAGAGGGNPARTKAVDFEAAVRTMDAAQHAGVRRFVIVSYATAAVDPERIDPDDTFYPYAVAKNTADTYLRSTDLDYTILGPGSLTLEPATRRIQVADSDGTIAGRTPTPDEKKTSRENVAEVIVHVVAKNAAVRDTVNFYDGQDPIVDAIPARVVPHTLR